MTRHGFCTTNWPWSFSHFMHSSLASAAWSKRYQVHHFVHSTLNLNLMWKVLDRDLDYIWHQDLFVIISAIVLTKSSYCLQWWHFWSEMQEENIYNSRQQSSIRDGFGPRTYAKQICNVANLYFSFLFQGGKKQQLILPWRCKPERRRSGNFSVFNNANPSLWTCEPYLQSKAYKILGSGPNIASPTQENSC